MDFNFQNSLPIWKQLCSQLKAAIVTGQYPPGSRFPSVRELAAEAGVNPNTMQRAMTQLETEGLISTNRTAGRSVTDDCAVLDNTRRSLAEERALLFLEDMKALGYDCEAAAEMVRKGMNHE